MKENAINQELARERDFEKAAAEWREQIEEEKARNQVIDTLIGSLESATLED